MQLSKKMLKISPSGTVILAQKARQLKAEGKDIIELGEGEPDFNTPEFIKDAAVKAIEDNYNSYTPVDGYDALKDSIIHKFKRDNNLNFDKSQIVVSTGAKQSLYNIASVLIEKDDEVILPCPYWVSYSDIIKLKGGIPVEIKTDIKNDFKMTAFELESSITPNTKMIWFSSPCNPSGSVYDLE